MRVALFTHQWPEVRLGGIGSCVRQLAAALASAGHEPHVFTLTLDVEARKNLPARVLVHEARTIAERVQTGEPSSAMAAAINSGGEGIYRLSIGWLLAARFREVHQHLPFDILEAPDVEALALPLLLDADRDFPIVTHLHCCTAIAHEANRVAIGQAEQLIQSLEFAAIHLADGVCAPTQAVVDATRSFTPFNRNPTIVPYPFATTRDSFTPPPLDGPILFQGRLEWLKGCAVIADALNIFLARNPTARFRFIGPDTSTAPGGRSMRRHILDTLDPAIADRVEILGEISRERVDAEIAGCSFFVQPSLRENFSLVLCEAMAAGRTVIVGEGTGSVEVIGDAGEVISRGSALSLSIKMECLYRDRVRMTELSRKAYDRIRKLCDPATITQQRVEFYNQTIEGFRRKRAGESRMDSLPAGTAAALLPAISQMTGALSGITQSQSPGARLADIFGKIRSESAGSNVLLYGAGKHTMRLLSERDLWERLGHRVVGVIDDHPRFAELPRFLDLPVQSLAAAQAAVTAGESLPAIVLSTDTYEDQFWEQTATLRQMGVPVFRLYGHRKSA